MKITFLTQRYWPHIGGVEKHIKKVSEELKNRGHQVKIISNQDIKYPKIKFLGLIYIWFWLFKNRHLIEESDVVHCHDVFVWYLPFRFLYPRKKVFTTFHGWEGKWPLRWQDILLKRIAAKLSSGTIAVGHYIKKYYGLKVNKVIYGAV